MGAEMSLDRAIIKLMEVHNVPLDKFEQALHVRTHGSYMPRLMHPNRRLVCFLEFIRFAACSSLTLDIHLALARAFPLLSMSLKSEMKLRGGGLLALCPRLASGKVYIVKRNPLEGVCMPMKPGTLHLILHAPRNTLRRIGNIVLAVVPVTVLCCGQHTQHENYDTKLYVLTTDLVSRVSFPKCSTDDTGMLQVHKTENSQGTVIATLAPVHGYSQKTR